MTKQQKCTACNGSGKLPIRPGYAKILAIVEKHGEKSGSFVANNAGIGNAQACQTLRAMERAGLVTSVQDGRQRLWKAV
jgi:hypothetical protein